MLSFSLDRVTDFFKSVFSPSITKTDQKLLLLLPSFHPPRKSFFIIMEQTTSLTLQDFDPHLQIYLV